MKLSKRLKQLHTMIPDGYDHIWDCCCDHGLLGMTLLNENSAPNIHFVDIVPALIEELNEKLTQRFPLPQHKGSKWKTYAQDVSDIPLKEHRGKHLVIIAGVGGDETIALVSKLKEKHPLLDIDYLLCPVYHQYAVRQRLNHLGFSLLDEALVKERKQIYEILYVSSNAGRGREIANTGSELWHVRNTEEFEIAGEYLQRTLQHYIKSRQRLGQKVEGIIQAYEACKITIKPEDANLFRETDA